MPCSNMQGITSGDIASSEAREAKKIAQQALFAANEVTDILCRVLRKMTPEQIAALDPDVQTWFAKRRQFDAQQGRPRSEGQ